MLPFDDVGVNDTALCDAAIVNEVETADAAVDDAQNREDREEREDRKEKEEEGCESTHF